MIQIKEIKRKVLDDLDRNTKNYTPDQKMPAIIYELNDDEIDYLITQTIEDYRTFLLKEIEEEKKKVDNNLFFGFSIGKAIIHSFIGGLKTGLDKASEIISKHN